MNSGRSIILYFVKYPTPGTVKTRLAKSVGETMAADIYRRLAEMNFSVLRQCPSVDVAVLFDPPSKEQDIRSWLAGADHYVAQQGTGLGDRLIHAFDWAFDQGYAAAAAVGSDILELTPQIVEEAVTMLSGTDTVLGPARDGGYYLIGLKQTHRALFEHIDWSTPEVLAQTRRAIERLNLESRLLAVLDDLDELTPADALSASALYSRIITGDSA